MQTTADQIEAYLNNEISKEERSRFDEKLKTDQNFAGEVEAYAKLFNAFDEIQAQSLVAGFNKIEEEQEGGKEGRLGFPVYLRWAAGLVFLATLGFLVYLNSGNSDKELFLAYYTVYPNVENPVARSESSPEDVWFFYESGNLAEASKLFKRRIADNDADAVSWFYLGICELEMDRINEAEHAFTKVIARRDNKYYEQAQWYLALSYLKAGRRSEAIAALEVIESSSSAYKAKATKLHLELK
jgi:tetratricopeptide (TPR) repeat protein